MKQGPVDEAAYTRALAEFDRALRAGERDGSPVDDLPELAPLGDDRTMAVFVHRPKQTRRRARRPSR